MHRIFFLFLFFKCAIASTQETTPVLISGDFRGITIDEFVKQVEAQSRYHFYYNPAQFDLLIISSTVKDKTLGDVLNDIFKNSEYNFSIDGQRVFLLKG